MTVRRGIITTAIAAIPTIVARSTAEASPTAQRYPIKATVSGPITIRCRAAGGTMRTTSVHWLPRREGTQAGVAATRGTIMTPGSDGNHGYHPLDGRSDLFACRDEA